MMTRLTYLRKVTGLQRGLLTLALTLPWLATPAGSRAALQVLPGGGTLTVLEPGAPDTLDPLLTRTAAGADATAGVFDALVRIDATGAPRPDLAARWAHSVDARTWTIYLDRRALWHAGEPATAVHSAITA